jgi:hypothetical protein
MVTIPRGKDAASRGGGEALPHRKNTQSASVLHKESLTKIKLGTGKQLLTKRLDSKSNIYKEDYMHVTSS